MSLVLIGAYTDYTGELSLLGKYYSYQVAVQSDQSDQSDGQGEQRAEQVLILTMIIKLSSRSPPGKSDGWAEGGITDGLDLDLTGIEINEHQQLSLLTLTITLSLTLT